jgi:DNA invertase Pin-like site-specific DNA recombinase
MKLTSEPMKLALYCRVSTENQNLEPQLLELRNAAKMRGITPLHEITDVISGSKASRTGLDHLMALVEARQIDAIMVVKLDRLARSLTNFVHLTATLDRCGVALIIPGQGIDTSSANPCADMLKGMLAVIAQFERSLIQERTRAGLAVARANGKILGRPSKRMPVPALRGPIVDAWRARTGGADYDALALDLGGVTRATAWREAAKWPKKRAAAPAISQHAGLEMD